ncbi:hypothetical protein, partial [Methylobacterium mesophilicum]|uniref:hypothetical protein n=1 Tax=Methylobacterium mesophilicum TaxID=39956 RepID=UPI003617FF19
WSAGEHSVSIHLLADASDPGQQLFVGGATHNGSNIAGSTYSVASGTANQFVFHQDHWMVS